MNSDESIKVILRFYEAIEKLIETGQIRGVKRETKHYPIPKKIEFTTPEGKKVVHETGYDITKGIFENLDDIKAAHWSLKFGGLFEPNAIPAMSFTSTFNASFAASSKKLPVPAEQASFIA